MKWNTFNDSVLPLPIFVQLELDGRNIEVKGYEKGNFVGPTVLTDVKVCTQYTHITYCCFLLHVFSHI